jgi:hypothetical protein
MLKPTRIVAPAEYEIPAQFCREIGRIIVRWAYLENAVRRLTWDILQVDQKLGRVAIRDPRMDDYFDMILDIAHLKKVPIDQTKISSLITRSNETAKWRDLLCHGMWVPTPNGWVSNKSEVTIQKLTQQNTASDG